jgi:hypothetical protein
MEYGIAKRASLGSPGRRAAILDKLTGRNDPALLIRLEAAALSVLQELVHQERDSIHAYYVDGKSIADISRSLHCTESVFADLLIRTRRKIFCISTAPVRLPDRTQSSAV